jgi:glycosyltransferase involved in cell wall biosynthesis
MKIILLADKLPPDIGGMETHAKYFVEYFSKHYELTIISNRNGKDVMVNTNYQTIKEIVLIDYIKSFENEKCIIFYNSGYWIEKFLIIKLLLTDAVFLYRTGGNEVNKAPLLLEIDEHSERQNYWVKTINQSIDFLIANSQFTKQRLIDLGIHNHIIRIISGGIDVTNIQTAMDNILQTRNTLYCNESEPLIACCCRFVPYKRPDFLLRSFHHLPRNYKIVLVGDGVLFENAKTLANELNLNVQFLGRLSNEETLNVIAASNVYCQASTDLIVNVKGGSYLHTEGMGRSLIEAICCGTRVVVTDCGAIKEFINSKNGTLAENHENEFAKQIEYALSMPIIEESHRQNYLNAYSFENVFNQYETLWS